MITTKEQERKALVAIKEIVDGLGEDSYIGTALDGCLKDAEQNIKDDAAYSMKSRYEDAERTIALYEDVNHKQKLELGEMKHRLEDVRTKYEAVKKKTLDSADLETVRKLAADKITEIDSDIKSAENAIISHSTNPESNEFQKAVRLRLNKLKYKKTYTELLTKVTNIIEEEN